MVALPLPSSWVPPQGGARGRGYDALFRLRPASPGRRRGKACGCRQATSHSASCAAHARAGQQRGLRLREASVALRHRAALHDSCQPGGRVLPHTADPKGSSAQRSPGTHVILSLSAAGSLLKHSYHLRLALIQHGSWWSSPFPCLPREIVLEKRRPVLMRCPFRMITCCPPTSPRTADGRPSSTAPRCFWAEQRMRRETQNELLVLLRQLCQHYATAALAIAPSRASDAMRVLTTTQHCDSRRRRCARKGHRCPLFLFLSLCWHG